MLTNNPTNHNIKDGTAKSAENLNMDNFAVLCGLRDLFFCNAFQIKKKNHVIFNEKIALL